MSSGTASAPKVGVGLFVMFKDGSVLIGKRKGSIGSGTYALPGGHLEFGESFEDCAAREAKEETDLDIDPAKVKFLTATNGLALAEKEGKHYITVFMGVRLNVDVSLVRNMEPNKCDGWFAVKWDQMWEALASRDESSLDGVALDLGAVRFFSPLYDLREQRPAFGLSGIGE